MNVEDFSTSLTTVLINSVATVINYVPSVIGGLIILTIGLILAAVAYRVIIGVLKTLQIEKFLARYGITQIEGKEIEWSEVLAELVRWAIIIVFLIPTLQAWHLDAVNTVLTRVILYIPNVIVAVILAIVGLVFAKLGYRVAYSSSRSLGKETAHTAGLLAQWSITIFVVFLVLHQLGVAQELLRILFGGFVAMVAIAGGLAFGLGGQGTAKNILEKIWDKFNK